MARITAGGGLDTSFNPAINFGEVRSVAILNPSDPHSKILIGGVFSIGSGGNTYTNLADWTNTVLWTSPSAMFSAPTGR